MWNANGQFTKIMESFDMSALPAGFDISSLTGAMGQGSEVGGVPDTNSGIQALLQGNTGNTDGGKTRVVTKYVNCDDNKRRVKIPNWNNLSIGEKKSIILLFSFAGIQVVEDSHPLHLEITDRAVYSTNAISIGKEDGSEMIIKWGKPSSKDTTTSNSTVFTSYLPQKLSNVDGGFEFEQKIGDKVKKLMTITGYGEVIIPGNLLVGGSVDISNIFKLG